ncbi:flagellar protein FlaG [Vreelandella sp. EE27]
MDSLPLDSSVISSSTSASSPPAWQMQPLRQESMASLLQAPTQSQPPATEVSREELEEPIARLNEALRDRGVEFEVSEEASRIIARVIDRETGDVIRQIPSEEVLEVAKRIEEMKGGIISLEA